MSPSSLQQTARFPAATGSRILSSACVGVSSVTPKFMTSVTADYTDIQTQPELDQWSTFLRVCSLENSRLSEIRRNARRRLVQAAEQYVLRLQGIAEEADLPALKTPVFTGTSEDTPLVMTGHQPVVFHSGLTFKYETTQRFVGDNEAVGLAVIIDTDQGDAGQFSFPHLQSAPDAGQPSAQSAGRPELAIETLAEPHRLYGHARLKSPAELKAIGQSVSDELTRSGQTSAAERTQQTLTQFAQLSAAKATMTQANTIMRRQHGIGDQLLELPLSAIAAFPECLMLTADILKQPLRFASGYNAALRAFRDEYNIRNTANPFPDLKVEEHSCELPFWIVDHDRGKRYVLEVQLDGNMTKLTASGKTVDSFAGNITSETLEPMLLQNLQIIPRGALITAFLRLLFSDLFVHGTGGARYDRFTDELMRSWWNAEPPPFTVATASRHLFSAQRTEIARLQQVKADLRELQYNPQRYFGQAVFSAELEQQLVALMKEKQAAVDAMKSFHADGQSAKEAGSAIQHLTNAIKQAVVAEFEPQLQDLHSITGEQMDAINCRTYPWFFYSR